VKNAKPFLIGTSIVMVMTLAIWYDTSYRMGNPSVKSESGQIAFPKIDRRPPPVNFHRGGMTAIPTYDPNSDDPWQMDLRSYDLSALDLSGSLSALLYATYDDRTAWPPDDRMPAGFDRQRIMELGKDPGLGIRGLHAQGITGRGVGIAIIDQTLLVDHQEYAAQLRLYEEIGAAPEAEVHGAAVASIAVGKTVGVAPEADLYYIATSFGGNDFTNLAHCIQRILEVNGQLPPEKKIRVISISVGWGEDVTGYDELQAAVEEAKNASMLVVCSSIVRIYGLKFHGLGRSPLADPDGFESYEPGMFWAKSFYSGEMRPSDRLLVPMDSRTTASPTGISDYVFYREGGWSWSIPYIAGLYALAAQVDPKITPERFWSLAMETGRTIELKHDGETIPLGPIVDPVALIGKLQTPS
jgi:hypothetical protein